MQSSHTLTLSVRANELRENGAAGHSAILHWFQEAAIAASSDAGYGLSEYDALGAVWVMRDMDVEFHVLPHYGEQIYIKTWVSDFRRIRSHREYLAHRASDGALVAAGRSEWIFVDRKTMMPRRLSAEMIASFEANGIPALEPLQWEFAGEALGEFHVARRVQSYEIDQMQHVNNAVYVNWIEQQVLDAWRTFGRNTNLPVPRRHYVQYLQAAQYGDELDISSTARRAGERVIWSHAIRRGETILVLAHSCSSSYEPIPE